MFEGGTTRGFSRRRSDGTYISSEYIDPYGYVIPTGKCLVITDLSTIQVSANHWPQVLDEANARDREGLQLGLAADHHVRRKPTVLKQQGDRRHRQHEHGFAVRHGCYLSVTPPVHGDLVSTELLAYGYLKPL